MNNGTNSSDIVNGNGSNGSAKPPSALVKLLAESKGKKVSESDRKAITNAFVKTMGERQKLLAALEAFDAKADETAVNMVRCYGVKHVTVGGVRYVPTSRGTRVYYKRMSDQIDTVALDA
jgi:hypothetical protein